MSYVVLLNHLQVFMLLNVVVVVVVRQNIETEE